MKKLTVTLSGLNESNAAGSVIFKVWQRDKLLIEDTLKGKVSERYSKVYDIDGSNEPVRIEHNRNDLPSLKITARIA
ncbi:hypothetical protein [Xenorhabdus budapestensis]|uniref:Uncharacterized protein n=1 Tax=Xenorhabdus budapestensis TaxID=290110 RepID=A0A2D0IMM4_XENBU|nr:hypothetical protein [Xenorhabdus budapestensis]PHM23032.1 hypothetical protein Xbud_03681 [Xenorhabdus budapestensis]